MSRCKVFNASSQINYTDNVRRKIVTLQRVVTYKSCDATVGLTTTVAGEFYDGVLDSSYNIQSR